MAADQTPEAWLSIIGLGEDGLEGLTPASRTALDAAEVIMGPARHMELVPNSGAERITWPVPFADGLKQLEQLKGRKVAVLASGDPFWFGAGSVIARKFKAHEWRAFPGQSCFSLMAARMGLAIETCEMVPLHNAPLERLRPLIGNHPVLMMTLRDGAHVAELADYLSKLGADHHRLTIFEHLGGPKERQTTHYVGDALGEDFAHPVCAALQIAMATEACLGGGGMVRPKGTVPLTSGWSDDCFEHDGQITKRPVRALTLSTLAPREGELLLDIGGGSGSISIEWCLSGKRTRAVCLEKDPERAARIRRNAEAYGVGQRIRIIEGAALETLKDARLQADIFPVDAVFVGGGLSDTLLNGLAEMRRTRLVANAVTLESEALLARWHEQKGGVLQRFEFSEAAPIGSRRGWKASYPVVQWSVVL